MSDEWADAYNLMVEAMQKARDAGVVESEMRSAVDDLFHEPDEAYEGGGPKRPKRP